MRILDFPRPIIPPLGEVYRLLGYPGADAVSAEVRDLTRDGLARAPKLLEPWAGLLDVGLESVGPEGVKIFEGPQFHSEALGRILQGCPCGLVCLVTIGWRLESDIKRLHMLGEEPAALVMDAIGSAAVEAVQREVGQRLCAQYEPQDLHVTRHYSPGYTGWPLEDQHALFELLERAGDPLRVRLTEAAMMVPRKSLTSIWGISDAPVEGERTADAIACTGCDMHDCDYRRLPYRFDSGGAGGGSAVAEPPPAPAAPRVQPVQYAMAAKALGKWARQLLSSEPTESGAIHYRFRFLGSTCSSGGTPISAVLHAIVRPRPEGMVFEKGWIEIPEDDPGLHAMCTFYGKRWAFYDALAHAPAYCGQTLERILTEVLPDLPVNPAGCMCKQAHVNHKWRMVLSTIHYALAMADSSVPSSEFQVSSPEY